MGTVGRGMYELVKVIRFYKLQEGLARTIKGKARCVRGFCIKITQVANGRRLYF